LVTVKEEDLEASAGSVRWTEKMWESGQAHGSSREESCKTRAEF